MFKEVHEKEGVEEKNRRGCVPPEVMGGQNLGRANGQESKMGLGMPRRVINGLRGRGLQQRRPGSGTVACRNSHDRQIR